MAFGLAIPQPVGKKILGLPELRNSRPLSLCVKEAYFFARGSTS
jgi:hypothetical protein